VLNEEYRRNDSAIRCQLQRIGDERVPDSAYSQQISVCRYRIEGEFSKGVTGSKPLSHGRNRKAGKTDRRRLEWGERRASDATRNARRARSAFPTDSRSSDWLWTGAALTRHPDDVCATDSQERGADAPSAHFAQEYKFWNTGAVPMLATIMSLQYTLGRTTVAVSPLLNPVSR
jgi:hypothetical protein